MDRMTELGAALGQLLKDRGESIAMGAANGPIVQGAHLGQLLGPPTFAATVVAHGTWSATVWPLTAGSGLAMVLALFLRHQERRQAKS